MAGLLFLVLYGLRCFVYFSVLIFIRRNFIFDFISVARNGVYD